MYRAMFKNQRGQQRKQPTQARSVIHVDGEPIDSETDRSEQPKTDAEFGTLKDLMDSIKERKAWKN